MTNLVPVSKDPDAQHEVPTAWRKTFKNIVDEFVSGNFLTESKISSVCSISVDDAELIKGNIATYGRHLCALPEETWDTSACQWMLEYWDVIIDLFTVEEGLSDLVLGARVVEDADGYEFHITSVYVP